MGIARNAKRGLLCICLGGVMLGIAACGSGDAGGHAGGGDELARASDLIDRGQYSEAIYVLDARVKAEPRDMRARVLLSSAYAARAGVTLSSYTDFAEELSKWNEIDTILPTDGDTTFVQIVAKDAVRISLVIRSFNAIPVPAEQPRYDDLYQAKVVLDQAPIELHGGPALYRALLKTAVFKHDILTKYHMDITPECLIPVPEVMDWLKDVDQDLGSILGDVSLGMVDPSTRASVSQISSQIHQGVTQALGQIPKEYQTATIPMPQPLKQIYGGCQ